MKCDHARFCRVDRTYQSGQDRITQVRRTRPRRERVAAAGRSTQVRQSTADTAVPRTPTMAGDEVMLGAASVWLGERASAIEDILAYAISIQDGIARACSSVALWCCCAFVSHGSGGRLANHSEGTTSTSHGMATCVESGWSHQVCQPAVSQSIAQESQGQGSTTGRKPAKSHATPKSESTRTTSLNPDEQLKAARPGLSSSRQH